MLNRRVCQPCRSADCQNAIKEAFEVGRNSLPNSRQSNFRSRKVRYASIRPVASSSSSKSISARLPIFNTHERLRIDKTLGLICADILDEGFSRKFRDVARLLNSIANIIKTDSEVSEEDFFKPNAFVLPVIHAANGMVCIDKLGSVELKSFDPEYRSRNQIDIAYSPHAECLNYREQLLDPVLCADDIDVLQRYCGLILLQGNRAQKLLLLLGKAGTGKGTIVRLITLVIGRAHVVQLRVARGGTGSLTPWTSSNQTHPVNLEPFRGS